MQSLRRALPLRVRRWLEMRMVRLLTYSAGRAPWAWRGSGAAALMRGTFDPMARVWENTIGGHGERWIEPLLAGLDELTRPPTRVLDLGTGTGAAAAEIARRFPSAEVTGADLAPRMVARAGEVHADLNNLRFVVADAADLPFNDAGFDLVVLLNAPIFFEELARVVRPAGSVLVCFTFGDRTPIFLPTAEVERKLAHFGFERVHSGRRGQGVWTLGVRRTQ